MTFDDLARLCTADLGREVTSLDVVTYLTEGTAGLERFTPEERSDIRATLIKEMAIADDPMLDLAVEQAFRDKGVG